MAVVTTSRFDYENESVDLINVLIVVKNYMLYTYRRHVTQRFIMIDDAVNSGRMTYHVIATDEPMSLAEEEYFKEKKLDKYG